MDHKNARKTLMKCIKITIIEKNLIYRGFLLILYVINAFLMIYNVY